MAIKILTKNSIENTNIDGARDNNFNAGRRSGIVKGALNEGDFFLSSSNSIAFDTCELRLCGHRVVIDSVWSKSFSTIPTSNTKYSLVATLKSLDDDVTFTLDIQLSSINLIQDNLDLTGKGTYQLEIGNFILKTDGTISDIKRTAKLITGMRLNEKEPAFDLIIRTQEEFEELISSPNWLGAKSIAFIGNGGDFKFTHSGAGLVVPNSVFQIEGFNNAIIFNKAIEYARTSSFEDIAELSYFFGSFSDYPDELRRKHTIKNINLEIMVSSSSSTTNKEILGFKGCYNMYNCRVDIRDYDKTTETGAYININKISPSSAGFEGCLYINNCSSKIISCRGGTGYDVCSYINNSDSNIQSYGGDTGERHIGKGFYGCQYLNGCICEVSIGNFPSVLEVYGFNQCSYLTNCYVSSLAGGDDAYYNIQYASLCRKVRGQWSGINSKIDPNTCDVD